MPNILETHYDELESETDFNLFYVKMADLKKFLHKCIDDGSIDPSIGREMLLVEREYKEVYGGN